MDENGVAVLSEVVKKKKDRSALEVRMSRLVEIKRQMDDLKKESDEIRDRLVGALTEYGVRKVSHAGRLFSVFNGTSVTINADLLRSSMLNHGVNPALVKEVIEEGTKRTPYVTITVREMDTVKSSGGITG